jgi:hypothetical protein
MSTLAKGSRRHSGGSLDLPLEFLRRSTKVSGCIRSTGPGCRLNLDHRLRRSAHVVEAGAIAAGNLVDLPKRQRRLLQAGQFLGQLRLT